MTTDEPFDEESQSQRNLNPCEDRIEKSRMPAYQLQALKRTGPETTPGPTSRSRRDDLMSETRREHERLELQSAI